MKREKTMASAITMKKTKIGVLLCLICIGGFICVFWKPTGISNAGGTKSKVLTYPMSEQHANMDEWEQYRDRNSNKEINLSQIKTRFEELPTEQTIHRNTINCTKREGKLSTKRLPVTGLASFPGSGNTWTRHLIQQMTGIATSSKYCDKTLLENGFPFECYADKSRTIVVKTHASKYYSTLQRLVLLTRNPFDALLSQIHFIIGGHTSRPGISLLKEQMDMYFDDMVRWFVALMDNTVKNFHGPVHILQYDRMKSNLTDELQKLAQFLNVNVTQHDIDCTVMLQEGNFHRKKNLTEQFNILKAVYSPKQLLILRDVARYSEMLIHRAYGLSTDIGGRTEQMLF